MFYQKIKTFFLNLLKILRRALCIFQRRKRDHPLPYNSNLSSVDVVYNEDVCSSGQQKVASKDLQYSYSAEDWNSWREKPPTIEEHILEYRQQIAKQTNLPPDNPETDLFCELTPTIKPQIKHYLGPKREDTSGFTRLQAVIDLPISINAELEDWTENEPCDWEDLDLDKTKQLLRDSRRQMRHSKGKAIHSNKPV